MSEAAHFNVIGGSKTWQARINLLAVIKKYFELEDYTPHLTLGQTLFGMNFDELKAMEQEVRSALIPYPTFEVDFVRLYQEIEPDKYVKFVDIPLRK